MTASPEKASLAQKRMAYKPRNHGCMGIYTSCPVAIFSPNGAKFNSPAQGAGLEEHKFSALNGRNIAISPLQGWCQYIFLTQRNALGY